MTDCAREEILKLVQPPILVGVVKGRAGELRNLETKQIGFARSGSGISTKLGELLSELAAISAGLHQRPKVGAGEAVERVPLRPSSEQGLVCMLAVKIYQQTSFIRQGRGRSHSTIYVRPRPAIGGHDSRQDQFAIGELKSTFDHCLARSRADNRGIGPPTKKEVYRPHHHSFPGPRFAGEGSHACPEDQR